MQRPWRNSGEQLAAMGVLDYVSDLFTASPRESFSRVEVLVLLNAVRTDPELFAPEAVVAYEEAVHGATQEN